jgi:hypothetical protein
MCEPFGFVILTALSCFSGKRWDFNCMFDQSVDIRWRTDHVVAFVGAVSENDHQNLVCLTLYLLIAKKPEFFRSNITRPRGDLQVRKLLLSEFVGYPFVSLCCS